MQGLVLIVRWFWEEPFRTGKASCPHAPNGSRPSLKDLSSNVRVCDETCQSQVFVPIMTRVPPTDSAHGLDCLWEESTAEKRTTPRLGGVSRVAVVSRFAALQARNSSALWTNVVLASIPALMSFFRSDLGLDRFRIAKSTSLANRLIGKHKTILCFADPEPFGDLFQSTCQFAD